MTIQQTLPSWFKQNLPDTKQIGKMKLAFREKNLATVCESARCPNMGECWGRGVATFMIMGDICTRGCRFCAVKTGHPGFLNAEEPEAVAKTVKAMKLRYVVITSVCRDDLPDEGASHFVKTISVIRAYVPEIKIEVLIPDFSGREENLKTLAGSSPEVVGHNIETVRRLSPTVRPQADYERSLFVLRRLKELSPQSFLKSGFMVGLGETQEEIKEVMRDLLAVGCEILTIGQYLRPTQLRRHLPVVRFISPQEFEEYKKIGIAMGFKHVISGPLVRSSYIAEEGYARCLEAAGR